MNLVDKTGGPPEPNRPFAANRQSQQLIEAHEVIDVRVRDEDMFDTLDLARWQHRDVTEIEQDRPPFEQCFDIESRITGPPVDQMRMKERTHRRLVSKSASARTPTHVRRS